MKLISWKEMECPLTSKKEYCNAAKPNHRYERYCTLADKVINSIFIASYVAYEILLKSGILC